MTSKPLVFALFFIAAVAINTSAIGQNNSKNQLKPAPVTPLVICPAAQTMKAGQMYGLWRAVFVKPPGGLPVHATLRLEQHAEFSDSLAGTISRNLGAASGTAAIAGHAAKAFLAGDLEDGMLLLDESSDNLSITGTWNGEIVQDSCGRVVKGVWKDTSRSAADNTPDVPFTLTRVP